MSKVWTLLVRVPDEFTADDFDDVSFADRFDLLDIQVLEVHTENMLEDEDRWEGFSTLLAPEAAPREHVTDGGECWCNPEVVQVESRVRREGRERRGELGERTQNFREFQAKQQQTGGG